MLAERNRREQLIAESERAAQAEVDARAGVQRATAGMSEADSARDRLTNAHRAAVRALDERREEERRITALIERRRAAPDDGVGGDGSIGAPSWRRSWPPSAGCSSACERERAERAQRLERVRAGVAARHASWCRRWRA